MRARKMVFLRCCNLNLQLKCARIPERSMLRLETIASVIKAKLQTHFNCEIHNRFRQHTLEEEKKARKEQNVVRQAILAQTTENPRAAAR